ncbi:MAG: hypothetical protein KME17_27765 [Cyanosarcina radialis HA8281-LM2]|jgi:hypothetical protein|nr:hypothetical protein [Cyanosarcina radialis HA8281-LM2]
MNLLARSRQILLSLALVLILATSTACSGVAQKPTNTNLPTLTNSTKYDQIQRGNTAQGQDFGSWVVQTAKGLAQDAYVRDNNKLGVVITPQVRPNEVRPFAKSLVEGFHKNFPNRDLTVLMYAPDKKLILSAKYDNGTRQIQYQ